MGDTEDGRLRFCVPGETKALSVSTRCGVRRPAVDEFAHPQQAPLKLHEETWAGLLKNQGLRIPGGGNRSGVSCFGGLSFVS